MSSISVTPCSKPMSSTTTLATGPTIRAGIIITTGITTMDDWRMDYCGMEIENAKQLATRVVYKNGNLIYKKQNLEIEN